MDCNHNNDDVGLRLSKCLRAAHTHTRLVDFYCCHETEHNPKCKLCPRVSVFVSRLHLFRLHEATVSSLLHSLRFICDQNYYNFKRKNNLKEMIFTFTWALNPCAKQNEEAGIVCTCPTALTESYCLSHYMIFKCTLMTNQCVSIHSRIKNIHSPDYVKTQQVVKC